MHTGHWHIIIYQFPESLVAAARGGPRGGQWWADWSFPRTLLCSATERHLDPLRGPQLLLGGPGVGDSQLPVPPLLHHHVNSLHHSHISGGEHHRKLHARYLVNILMSKFEDFLNQFCLALIQFSVVKRVRSFSFWLNIQKFSRKKLTDISTRHSINKHPNIVIFASYLLSFLRTRK